MIYKGLFINDEHPEEIKIQKVFMIESKDGISDMELLGCLEDCNSEEEWTVREIGTKDDPSLTMELLHKQLEPTIMFDLEALKDFRDTPETFDYHFELLKGNLKDLFNGVVRNGRS